MYKALTSKAHFLGIVTHPHFPRSRISHFASRVNKPLEIALMDHSEGYNALVDGCWSAYS